MASIEEGGVDAHVYVQAGRWCTAPPPAFTACHSGANTLFIHLQLFALANVGCGAGNEQEAVADGVIRGMKVTTSLRCIWP